MEPSKANTTGSTNPHVRKQRQKISQDKLWEGDAAAAYLPWRVQELVLSKEWTCFKLLWKTTLEAQPWHWKGHGSQGSPVGTSCSRVAQAAAVSEQGGGDSQCLTNVGNVHALAWQACLRADQSPTAPPFHIHVLNLQIMPNSNLTSFVDEAGIYFLNLKKHNNIHEKILFCTP